ncbi:MULTISPECIES: cellulose biosynthesis cyclic di-GMP-binding regulatory protein BcsB [unclassified Inquilinus]|uniref:cellulose biosynthesis cyclic di-GMP-binding regulatory protein BcsB n=1 Tax=unclassified Inquilinus TaxID=2645927 RepID=UPI003F902C5A
MPGFRKPSRRAGPAWAAAFTVLSISAAASAQQIPLPGSAPAEPVPQPAPAESGRIPIPGQHPAPATPRDGERIALPATPPALPVPVTPHAVTPPAVTPPVIAPPTAEPALAIPVPSAPSPAVVIAPAPASPPQIPSQPAASDIGNRSAAAGAVQPVADVRLPLVPVEGTTGLRLGGEHVAARFAVVAPPLGPTVAATLSLTHISGADLLPERSAFSVSLNGKPIGSFSPDAFSTPSDARLPIPPGALQTGRNLVTITGQLTHRVLCSDTAGFDLWTQLDPNRSGILVPAGGLAPVTDLAGFIDAAAAAGARGDALPVSLRTPLTTETTGALVSLASLLGKVMPETSPSFTVGLGEVAAEGRPRIVLAGGNAAVSVRQAADGAPVLLLQGQAGELIAQQLAGVTPLAGSRSAEIGRGRRVTLTDLGLGDVRIVEYRRQVDAIVRLPTDFLVTNDSVAHLKLMFAYDAGLPPGGHLTLSLNGTALAQRPFDVSGGEVVENEDYALPLRLFHAGENTIRFDFSIPAQVPQQACPQQDENHPFATLFGDTTLTLDDAPHMVALPDLSLMAASGYLFDGSGPVALLLSDLDPGTVAAALTVSARLGAVADDPVRLQPILSMAKLSGPLLAIGPASTLPSGLFAGAPASPADIAPHLVAADGRNQPDRIVERLAGGGQEAAKAGAVSTPAAPSSGSTEARQAWRTQLDRQKHADTMSSEASSLWDDALGTARRLLGWQQSSPPVADWLSAQTSPGLGYVGQWQGPSGPITLVTALDPKTLSTFAARATGPAVWSTLGGDAALLLDDGWHIHAPAEQSLVITQPVRPDTVMMVAGHWFSRNGMTWTLAILGLSAAAAGVTHTLLGRLGVREKR